MVDNGSEYVREGGYPMPERAVTPTAAKAARNPAVENVASFDPGTIPPAAQASGPKPR